MRRSGLSVGAIYTHFSGKEQLFLAGCDVVAEQGLEELGRRLAGLTGTGDRLRAAVAYYVETVDEFDGAPGQVSLIAAWAEADAEPGVREMLVRRRERLVGAATCSSRRASPTASCRPRSTSMASRAASSGLMDGLLLQRIEAGDAFKPADLTRRAGAILDVLLAAPTDRPPEVATA